MPAKSKDGKARVRVIVPHPKFPKDSTKTVTWTHWERTSI